MSNLDQALKAYHNGQTLVCFTHKQTLLINRSACPEPTLLTVLKDTLKVSFIMFSIDTILGWAFIALSVGMALASYLTRDKKEGGQ